MLVSTRALVLSAVKYAEADLIVKCYTRQFGLKSYLLRGVRKSRKGKLRSSYFQPLTHLELTAWHKDKGTLERLKETRLARAYTSIHTDIRKASIVLFLSEVLRGVIREEEPNYPKFDFIASAMDWLDSAHSVANFHLLFLLELTAYLGFYPDSAGKDAVWFNLQEGLFTREPVGDHSEEGRAVELLRSFCGMDFEAIGNRKLDQPARREVLQLILRYYQLHVDGFREPRSLAVLNQLFN